MLRKQFKLTTVQNLHILLEQSVHILLMFFVLNTILSTSSFVRERLGITAKSREVTETTKNVSTTIWVSIPLLICKNRWGAICAVLTVFLWQFSVGNLLTKSTRNRKSSALDCPKLLHSSLGASPLLPNAKAFILTRYFYFSFFSLTSLTKLQKVI